MAKESEEDEIEYGHELRNEGVAEREEWIYTFADMVTLILCFFIILFASQNPEILRFEAISAAFRGGPPASPFVFTGGPSILERFEETIKGSDLLSDTSINIDDRGISVQLGESVLFRQGSAVLSDGAKNVISKFAILIQSIPNSVIVEGYADPSFKANQYYRNAWELSSTRAARVIDQLEAYGVPTERMELISFGATRPRVIGTGSNFVSINNRVEILIRPDDGPPPDDDEE